MRRFSALPLACALAASLAAGGALAQDRRTAPSDPASAPDAPAKRPAPGAPMRVMIVLDASGSMWGRVAGEPKIAIARRALDRLLREWDDNTQIGLTAYGHRRKGDCGDIETVVPVGRVAADRMMSIVNRINPKGKTPLSAAVRHAAETLKYTEERATVILISDGRETCNADPCAVGKALKSAGIDFRAHVIGFGLKRGEEAGLRCLAANTGGKYYSADDAEQLRAALRETARDAQQTAPPAEPEKPDEAFEATLDGPASVQIAQDFKVTWTGPDRRGDFVTIAPKGSDDRAYLSYAYTSRGSPVALTAPDKPGEYELRYVVASPRTVAARRPITVSAVEATLDAPASAQIGAEVPVKWTGPDGSRDYITVVAPKAAKDAYRSYRYTRDGTPAKIRMPEQPGTYEIRYVTGQTKRILARHKIVVREAEATVTPPAEVVIGKRFKVAFTGPANARDYVTIVKPSADNAKYGSYHYARNRSPGTLTAPTEPGDYEIRYVTGTDKRILARAPIKVITVDSGLEAPEAVTIGNRFEVRWTGPGALRDYVTIVEPAAPAGKYRSYAYTRRNPVTLTAPEQPGAFELRYVTAGKPKQVLARRKITVEEPTVTLDAPASVAAQSRFKVAWTGLKNLRDYITIVPKDAPKGAYQSYQYARGDRPVTLTAPKEPGEYEIRYVTAKEKRVLARRPVRVTAKE